MLHKTRLGFTLFLFAVAGFMAPVGSSANTPVKRLDAREAAGLYAMANDALRRNVDPRVLESFNFRVTHVARYSKLELVSPKRAVDLTSIFSGTGRFASQSGNSSVILNGSEVEATYRAYGAFIASRDFPASDLKNVTIFSYPADSTTGFMVGFVSIRSGITPTSSGLALTCAEQSYIVNIAASTTRRAARVC